MNKVEQFLSADALAEIRRLRQENQADYGTLAADSALPFIKIAEWQGQPVPDRQWIVKDQIPAKNVTLLSGEGSIGKSILSLHLAVAVALGKDWLFTLPETGPVVAVCCEDDEDEIWRRLDLILKHYSASFADIASQLHILPLVAEDETLMAVPDRSGLIKTTKLFDRVCQSAADIKPKLIVLDNAADIFGGNENDRAQVRQFIGFLRKRLAIPTGAGVLLTAHPSLTGISSGSGLSGSTAWNASVRSRLYFKRVKDEDDGEADPDQRTLEVMKLNYGRAGEALKLTWSNGLFVPVSGLGAFDQAAADQGAENIFLSLLDSFTTQGTNISPIRFAKNYAPTVFAKEKRAKAARLRKRDLEAAMDRLFEAVKIDKEPYGPPSRGTLKLVRK